MSLRLHVNGNTVNVDAPEYKPLLWVLREELAFTGTKFGCGVGICKACTVLIDGKAVQSCITPVGSVEGAKIITVEGLSTKGSLSAVQQAWIDEQVPQCGYCQSGFIMATTALLASNPTPTDEEIDTALQNICRCGTYTRVREAIHVLIEQSAAENNSNEN